MNRYYDYFCNMSDEEWEHFAVEVLKSVGFQLHSLPAYGIDGGKEFIVSLDSVKYIVSCKHFIKSGKHVGVDNEINITDRLSQFGANGFLGFYSTCITTGLQNRLDGICNNGNYRYCIFSPTEIIQVMKSMDTKVLQSFGLYPHKYYINVMEDEYKPLNCMVCGKDCLTDETIPNSLIGIAKLRNGKYEYIYGCKPCFIKAELFANAHLEMEQALHVRILQGWEDMVDEWIENEDIELSDDFYKNRSEFLNRVRQRQLPQTEGTWYGIDI